MRINEDYIENLEADELSQDEVQISDANDDKGMYQFNFYFRTRDVDITYVTENGWKSITDEFFRVIYGILDSCPFISEYRHMFSLYVGVGYYGQLRGSEPVKTIETETSHKVEFHNYNDPTRGRQPIGFMLQFDADVRTLERIRLLVIFLWRSFNVISRKTFLPEPQSIDLESVGGGYRSKPVINANNYRIWLNKSSDEASRKRYRNFIKAVRPGLTGREVNNMINDFLKENNDIDIAKVVDRLHKDTKGASRKLVDNALENVRIDDNGVLVITKDDCHIGKTDVQKLMKSKVKFRVEMNGNLTYHIDEYSRDDESLGDIIDLFRWIDGVFLGDWTLVVDISNEKFYGRFPNLEIDLRGITPNHTVRFKTRKREQKIYDRVVKFLLNGRKKLEFRIIDSKKTHKIDVRVEPMPGWYAKMFGF